MKKQLRMNLSGELVVDLFAGGGGASLGIEMATGQMVDIAINHDPEAVAMHAMNHPTTRHLISDVFEVDPLAVTDGQPVGLLWASPDCKHHSKAKGGKPLDRKTRSLAWVVVRWAKKVRPRVVCIENVEEFQKWGPLGGDGRPIRDQSGFTFRHWVSRLEALGYRVEWRELRACDYGAPTTRKRLFIVARCDGLPIIWPEPTHGDPANPDTRRRKLKPWRSAAECIDWSIPCPSIFERSRPLADATHRRIAKGVMRYVVNAARPFIVPEDQLAPFITEHANASSPRSHSAAEPLRTICAQVKGGHHALVACFLAKHYGGNCTNPASALDAPVSTVTAIDHHGLCAAGLIHMGHGEQSASGARRWSHGVRDIVAPLNTVTANGMPAGLVASSLVKLRNGSTGQDCREPLHTLTSGGHFAEVRAFLVKYYGVGQEIELGEPLHTVTGKDRFGLVVVEGQEYAIADIGLRMLAPRELFRAQGFPEDYIIDRGADGRPLTKTAQVRMCGNSVCPPLAAAIVRANYRAVGLERVA